MKLETKAALQGVALGIALIGTLVALTSHCGVYAIDSGTTHPAGALSSSAPAETPQAGSLSPASGGARLTHRQDSSRDQSGSEMRDASRESLGREVQGSPGMMPAGVLADYEDSFLPTEAGLIDMTLELWSQEDFLSLTQDEAHELLALDDTMGLKGPNSMLSIAGPLPTLEDCQVGFRSQAVQDALQQVCGYEVILVELGSVPLSRRPAGAANLLQEAIRMRDGAMDGLMAELEKATTFKSWRLWNLLYRRWSR